MRTHTATYVDLLALALAKTGADRFSGDAKAWHRFVMGAKELYPEEFRYVTFDTRDPDTPYSEEAEHALHVLAQSGKLSKANPSYRFLQMDGDQRDAIIDSPAVDYSDYQSGVDKLVDLVSTVLVVA